MRPLAAIDLVRIWEWGEPRQLVDRGIALLTRALPHLSREDVAGLSIGVRDGLLLQARAATFGESLEFYVACPACGVDLEFSRNARDLLLADPWAERPDSFTTRCGAYEIQFRLANSNDLAAASGAGARGREVVMGKCIQSVSIEGVPQPKPLPRGVMDAVAAAMANLDPQADLAFDVTCESCGNRWAAAFDILPFFWKEIGAQMKQIAVEVDTLARAYSWSEAEILSMSATRRGWYLELVGR